MIDEALHILLVEDEEGHADLIRIAFTRHSEGMHIRIVKTLAEAKQRIAENPPHLVLADLNLPDGRGTDLLTKGSLTQKYPLVILTAHGDQKIAAQVIKDGAIDYVVKSPETFKSMPNTVHRALREWEHIVKRKQAENTLKIYEQIISSTTDFMSFINVDYIYLVVNDTYVKSFNKNREEIVGRSVAALLGDEVFSDGLKLNMDKCLAGEYVNFQNWYELPATGRRYLNVKYYPYITDNETVSGIVVCAHDMTNQKIEEENHLKLE